MAIGIFMIAFIAFQSAPHFSSEANLGRPPTLLLHVPCFNPRLTSAARRTALRRVPSSALRVSIRASLQQRGERRIRNSHNEKAEFKSAPHFRSEANGRSIKLSDYP